MQRSLSAQFSRSKLLFTSLFIFAFGSIASFLLIPHESTVYAKEIDLPISQANNQQASPEILTEITSLRDTASIKKIYTETPYLVTISYKDRNESYVVYSSKIKDILDELNIKYEGYKTVPNINATLNFDNVIKMIALDVKFVTKIEAIGFDSRKVTNPEMMIGTSSVLQKGVNGEMTTVLQNIYEDGALSESIIFSREITKQPIAEIIEDGTKTPSTPIKSCDIWGKVIDSVTTNQRKRDWMKSVMYCESKCDAGAKSKLYFGLFQFLPSTFTRNGGKDIFNGEEQIKIVSKMYDQGQQYQWGDCNKSFNTANGSKY